jgi:hypothetical protein
MTNITRSYNWTTPRSNAKYIVLGTLIFAGVVFIGWILSTSVGVSEVMDMMV